MGRKSIVINLSAEEREYLETQTRARGLDVQGKSKHLSSMYELPYISFGDLNSCNINNFDLLIVGVALAGKYKVIEKLINDLKYCKCLIIDKPLSIDRKELEGYRNLFNSLNSYAVVCQRDFDDMYYKITMSSNYYITWYSLTEELTTNIIDRLPHLLSWLIREIGSDINIEIYGDYLYGTIENSTLEIHFIKSDVHGVEINGTWYKSPDYRQLNRMIVEKVYRFSKEDSIKNFNRALTASTIMCDLLEQMNS